MEYHYYIVLKSQGGFKQKDFESRVKCVPYNPHDFLKYNLNTKYQAKNKV